MVRSEGARICCDFNSHSVVGLIPYRDEATRLHGECGMAMAIKNLSARIDSRGERLRQITFGDGISRRDVGVIFFE